MLTAEQMQQESEICEVSLVGMIHTTSY